MTSLSLSLKMRVDMKGEFCKEMKPNRESVTLRSRTHTSCQSVGLEILWCRALTALVHTTNGGTDSTNSTNSTNRDNYVIN